ncbi:MAG: hypothetical protein RIS29_982 [Bacteroidota bacterium]|jgi:hypothetical protein
MRKLSLMLFASLMATATLLAQTSLKGVVKVAGTGNPLPGTLVTLLKQNISTQTNEKGEFTFSYLEAGTEEVSITRSGFFPQIKVVDIKIKTVNNIGVIELKVDNQDEVKQEIILQMSENEISDDEGRVTQASTTLSSKGDIYNEQVGFSFSPMRFSVRGYDDNYESTYINGVYFNGVERGSFNYSSFGGLNDATRNKEQISSIAPSSFSFGNLGTTSNINMRASNYAAGTKAGVALSNRSYKVRASIMHSTGMMPNGWAFAASAVMRYADEGIQEGTFYQSAGYMLSAEKKFDDMNRLSIVTFGAPTRRGQSSAATDDVYTLADSRYYNAYWGYYDGKKRNSRIVHSYDPTVIISHELKLSENENLKTGLAAHYSLYSNSALTFYNAPDPRPDYYRNLPYYQYDGQVAQNGTINGYPNYDVMKEITQAWASRDPRITQIDWDNLYRANQLNNQDNPTGNAKYALERRHNNLFETTLNSTYNNQLAKFFKLTGGIEAKYSKGLHYKTMDDLMGANQWIDIDQFAERDMNGSSGLLSGKDASIMQNDLKHPNRVIKDGNIFGYNYNLDIYNASAFLQNQWIFRNLELYYAAKGTYSEFSRYGFMENGRAVATGEQSYGRGKKWSKFLPAVKAGLTYKIDSKNRIAINAISEQKSPLPNIAYVSPRIKDGFVPGLAPEKDLSYDISYIVNYPGVTGRITAFETSTKDGVELSSYYDDSNRTFVNHSLSGVNKDYRGIEAALALKLNSHFTLTVAGTVADYHYTDSVQGVISYENGAKPDEKDWVMLKNIKLATGPQKAGSISLDYFHPKMWFAGVTLNYFDNNYVDVAPLRFTKKYLTMYTTDIQKQILGGQEKLKSGYMLDANLGKVIYLKNRRSLNINLTANNILNAVIKTGGFQQARVDYDDKTESISGNVYKYPSKYYYALGMNFFATVSYKF